ncbi:hypothetical protein C8R45DRAFT_385619 [Mycena sanguinolenta]|nr:hypothetical protein C8R45DRAFT_385619 [Mycena sanguinolenta]
MKLLSPLFLAAAASTAYGAVQSNKGGAVHVHCGREPVLCQGHSVSGLGRICCIPPCLALWVNTRSFLARFCFRACLLPSQYIDTANVSSKYGDVLAYNVGNEVLTASPTNAAPFVKAAARNVKAYLASISSSALVGYTDIVDAFRDTTIDLFGLNNHPRSFFLGWLCRVLFFGGFFGEREPEDGKEIE